MARIPVIGVDPGVGVHDKSGTGICAVAGRTVVAAGTVRRRSAERPYGGYDAVKIGPRDRRRTVWVEPIETYLDRVCDTVGAIIDHHDGWEWMVAAETVVAPTGFSHGKRSPIQPSTLSETSMIYGALSREFRAKRVRPGKHGKHHHKANHGTGRAGDYYPAVLIGARDVTLPTHPDGTVRDDGGPNSHILSAFDIAQHAGKGLPQ